MEKFRAEDSCIHQPNHIIFQMECATFNEILIYETALPPFHSHFLFSRKKSNQEIVAFIKFLLLFLSSNINPRGRFIHQNKKRGEVSSQ